MRILTSVDCDFEGYMPLDKRKVTFNEGDFFNSLDYCVKDLAENTGGRPAFLIHTSPFIRNRFNDLFLKSGKYLKLWRWASENGCALGVHPHEDEEDGSAYYYYFTDYMESVISNSLLKLKESGFDARYIRFGYFCLNNFNLPSLQKHKLISLDNMGGFLKMTASNFLSCPDYPYSCDPRDIEEKGDGPLIYPVGFFREENSVLWNALIPEANSEKEMKKLIGRIRLKNPDNTVCMLIHAYNYKKNSQKIKNILKWAQKNGVELKL